MKRAAMVLLCAMILNAGLPEKETGFNLLDAPQCILLLWEDVYPVKTMTVYAVAAYESERGGKAVICAGRPGKPIYCSSYLPLDSAECVE